MAVFFSQPGPRSMLKVDKSRTKCHNGFPRASDRPRMCPMSFGLLLFLWCFVADGQATSSPSPCPSMCNCYTLSPTSTDSVVDCSNAGLTTLSSIPYLFLPNSKWKVVQLNVSGNSISAIEAKSTVLRYLPDLELIDLSYNAFTSISSNSFSMLTTIRHLNISRNSITSIGANTFYSLSSLTSLDLSYNGITSLDATTFKYLTNLETLSLAGNTINKFKDKSFEVPSLTTLDLSGNPVESFEKLMFTSSSNIATLYINNMNLTSLPPYLFTNLRQLKKLYLHGNNLSSIPSDAFSSNPNLSVLDASYNQIQQLDDNTFSGLTLLEFIDVSYNELVTVNPILFSDLQSLTSLNVAFNKWTCTCSVKPFVEFLVIFNNTAGRTLVDWDKTTCAGQTSPSILQLSTQFLSCLCKQAPVCTCWGACNDASEIEVSLVKRSVTGTNCSPLVRTKRGSTGNEVKCAGSNENSAHCRDGASDYFSCYTDTDTGTVSTVVYDYVTVTPATSQQICTEECFKVWNMYALYNSLYCLCGNSTASTDYDCLCSGSHTDQDSVTCSPSSGSSVTKTYLANATFVSAGIILNTIPRLTALSSYMFTIDVTLDIINQFKISFGDSSLPVSMSLTGSRITRSYTYVVPGKYTLTVEACYVNAVSGSVCETASLPVLVDPPDALVSTKLSGPSYVGTISTATVMANIAMGRDLDISWARSPADGVTATSSSHCDASWTLVQGRCLQVSAASLSYDAAKSDCSSSALLNTIQHPTEVTDFATNILAISPSVASVYVGAKKSGTSFYKWEDNTYAYFSSTQQDVADSAAGDCVIIDMANKSLKGVACSSTHHYVCQKVPGNNCPHGGEYYSGTKKCYVSVATALSWLDASTACPNITTGASLATFNSAAVVSHVTANVLTGSIVEVWTGFSDQNMEGYLLWVNDESVSGYNPMSGSIPAGDCFSLKSDGTWNGHMCSATLSYLCQYSVISESVTVQAYVTGTVDLNPPYGAFTVTSLTASSTPTSESGVITAFPGYTFSGTSAMKLIAFTFKTANLTSPQIASFQIYKPECNTGDTIVAAGCNGNGALFVSCKSTATTCPPSNDNCPDGTTYCQFTDTCKPHRDPRDTCNSNPSGAGCSESYVGSAPTYKLAFQMFADIPSGAPRYYTIPIAEPVEISENDFIAYQVNTGQDVIFCETGGDWAQNAPQSQVGNWLSLGDTFSTSTWKNNTMCYFNAIYSKSVTKTMPTSLGYFTTAGNNEFQLSTLSPDRTTTHSVTAQEPVGQVTWRWPELQVGHSSPTVFVKSGETIDLVVNTDFGTDLSVTWTLGSTIATSTFANSCPSSVSAGLCDSYTNWPALPFTTTTHTFNSTSGNVVAHVSVSNQVSSFNLTVTVKAFVVISGLTITLDTTLSNVYVALNEASSFTVAWSAGTPNNYKYYINGTLQSIPSAETFTKTFTNLTNPYYEVKVNASDEYSYVVAIIVVVVKIRANFQGFQFISIPSDDCILENTLFQYKSRVSAVVGAEVSVMWIFGVEPPTVISTTIAYSTQDFLYNFTYTQTGSYSLAIFLQDSSFLSAKYITTFIDVVVIITSVTASTSSAVIREGDSVTLSVAFPSSGYHGKVIHYFFDFKDGSNSGNQTSNTALHVFSAASSPVYNVSVTASNCISSANAIVQVTVEEAILGLTLTGSSPILINTATTYTASVTAGSHISYQFQEASLNLPSAFASANTYSLSIATAGVYNLTVNATNTFTTLMASKEVRAVAANTLQILEVTFNAYVATATSVTFKVDALNINTANLHTLWNFGESTQVGTGLLEVMHTYTVANNYTITVTLVDNSTGVQAVKSSAIGVQETLTNLDVAVGSIGAIASGAAATVRLTASILNGTDVWYTYTFSGSSHLLTSPFFDLVHDQPAVIIVSVRVSNQISSLTKNVSVTFEKTITYVSVTCSSCTLNNTVNYRATNGTSTYTAVSDGTNVGYLFGVTGQSNVSGNSFTHAFTARGIHYINATAYNLVSSMGYSLLVTVQDAITSVTFNSSIKEDILVSTSLALDTSIVGSDAAYSWKVCSTCIEVTTATSTYTYLGYTASGSYTVTVVASNQISSATATLSIKVHDRVTTAGITSTNLVNGQYLPINSAITFAATANILQDVSFDWEIFNSVGTDIGTIFSTNNLVYTFTAEGTYIVKVTAINTPSFAEYNMTVIVDTPISGVTTGNNKTSPIATLAGLSLTVTVAQGSTLSYLWTKNSTTLSSTSANLVLALSPSSTYVISVTVTNPLGSVTKFFTYVVLDMVEAPAIVVLSAHTYYPFVAKGTSVQVSYSVTKGDQINAAWVITIGSDVYMGSKSTFDFYLTSVANYTLKLTVYNNVSSKEVMSEISVQTPLTSLTLASSHIAAKTSEMVTFTANHNTDADHLTYKFMIESVTSTITTDTKTHTFTSPGNYSVSVNVYNQLSNFTSSVTVTIENPVQGLALLNCNVTVNVTDEATTTASLTQGTNVVYTWTSVVGSNTETQTGTKFAYTYTQTGIYSLSLNVSNLVSYVTATCLYTIIGPISDVAITMSDSIYLYVGYTVEFTVTGTNLVGVTYNFSISPISFTATTTTGALSKVFTQTLDYVLTLTVSNDINTVTVTKSFSIDELTCTAPTVTAAGVTSKTVYKSNSVLFEVNVNGHSCTNYVLAYQWTVYSVSSCAVTLANAVTLASTVTNTPKLLLSNGTLTYGQYCVVLVASYGGTPLQGMVKFDLTVRKTNLVAVLSGGSVVHVPDNADVNLDGSGSYDPDYSTSLQNNWSCTRSGSSLTDACVYVFGSSSTINIPANSLTSGQMYDITLTVSASDRTSGSTTERVIVGNSNNLFVTVICRSCEASGLYTITSLLQLALSGTCNNNCGSGTVTYKWTASYVDGGTNTFTLTSSNTLTGDSSANLVVKSGQIVDGKTYTFRLTITKTENSVTTSSYVEIELPGNAPPTGTSCSAGSTTVIVFNPLSINCQGFSDPDSSSTELSYLVEAYSTDSASSGESVIIYFGSKSQVDVYLTAWPGVSRTTVQLKVFIIDTFNAKFLGLDQMITVVAPTLSAGQTMTDLLWEKTDGDLVELIMENSPKLPQFLIAIIHEFNEQSRIAGSPDTEKYLRATLRNILTIPMMGLPLQSNQDREQLSFMLIKLTSYISEFQNSLSEDLVLTQIKSLKTAMEEAGVREGLEQSSSMTGNLVGALSNIMLAVNMAVVSSSTTLVAGWLNETAQKYIIPASSTVQPSMLATSSLSAEEHRKSLITQGVLLTEDIAAVNLMTHLLGQNPLEIVHGNSLVVYGVKKPSDNLNLNHNGVSISKDTLTGILPAGTEVLQVYITSNPSPFTWGYTDFVVDTNMQSLTLKYITGTNIPVIDLDDINAVKMVLTDSDEIIGPITEANIVGEPGYDPTKNLNYKFTTIDQDTPQLLTLNPSTGVDGSAVFIQVGSKKKAGASAEGLLKPLLVSFYLGVDVASPSASEYSQAVHIVTNFTLPSDHRLHSIFLRDYDSSKTYRISIFINDTYDGEVEVFAAMYMASCMYYDTKELEWSSLGCTPSSASIAISAVCSCNHLTAFGGGMLVPIDAISFSDLQFIDLYTNPVVFITCAIIFVVYVVAAIIGRRLDLRDLERISFIPLCGKEGSFKYEITIVTGKQRNAGTSAHVGIKIHGEYGKSNRKHLSKKGAFQRNCQDSFIIAHDMNLGDISKVFIWHDNHGLDPSWYMVQVVVRDLQTLQKYYFFGNFWLTLEVEKGFIQKEIDAAGASEIQRFTRIFGHAWSSSVSDRHLWMSIVDRPANSRFTRVQRTTCIVTILYVFMCINVIWYGTLKTSDSTLGTSSFGWQEVAVAMATNAVVFPFSIILISIFKKSRSKNNVFDHGNREGTAETIEIDNNCSQSGYSSFQTNDDLMSYLGERESTTDSMLIPPVPPSKSLALRRTMTMKTSHRGIEKIPSSTDSFTSSVSSEKADGKIERNNSSGRWNKDKESLHSSLNRQDTESPPGTSAPSKSDRETVRAEVKDVADDIMEYLDTLEADMISKEQNLRKHRDPSRLTPGLTRKPPIRRATMSGSAPHAENSQPPSRKGEEPKKRVEPKKGSLMRKDSTRSVGLSAVASNSYSIPSTSGTRKNFTPRQEANLPDKKPPSAGSVSKWMSKLRSSGSTRSSTMPSVGNSDMEGVRPLRPNSLLARQTSQPDIIHHGVGSFTLDGVDIRKKKPGCTLPPRCIYLGYFLCFCLSVLSIIVVMLYGYKLDADGALLWVLALIFCVTFSFLMFESLKVLFMALYIAAIEKKVDPYDEHDVIDIEPYIDNTVETVKEMKFKPLAGFSLLKAKEEGQKVQRMQLMLRQTVAYVFYLWLLMVLCYVDYDSSQYHFTHTTESRFIYNTVSSNTYSFKNITSISEFWVWSQDVLSEELHWDEINNYTEYATLLGPVRLRQVRSVTEKCIAYESLVMLGSANFLSGKTCVGSDNFDEDQSSYAETWTINQSQNISWPYLDSDVTGSKWRQGNVFSYSGGGYVQYLGTNYQETLTVLQSLQAKDWINLHTRAIFIEFTLYSPATDLTTYVNLLVEFPLTGSANTSYEIQSLKLLRYISDIVDPLMVCEAILSVVVLYLWVHIALLIRDQGCSFFSGMWNLYELVTTLLAITVIGLYVGCVIKATDTFNDFLADTSSFVNFEIAVDVHLSMRYTQAWLLFLLMFKIVKQLRFLKILYIYEKTISQSLGKLMGVILIFAILLLSHGMVAYLMYGPYVGGFESYWHTLTSLFGAIRGTFDFWLLFENQRIFTHLFFYSFYIFVYGLTVGLVVAILSDTYKSLRSQMFFKSTLDMQDHEMIEFTMKRFKLWAGITKPKPEFRVVRFPGLPSVSSRCTSSSSSRSLSENSSSSGSGSLSSMGVNSANAAARLSWTWQQVLNTMERVSHLDGIEENLIKKCQKEIDEWKWQNRISNMEKENDNLLKKPPIVPNPRTNTTKIPKRATASQPRTTAKSEGAAKSPPSKPSVKDKPVSRATRPLSDQGGRAGPRLSLPGTDQERMSVLDFFKSVKTSKPAW